MAPPQGANLDIIVESETVEIVEGGDAQSEGATREPATGSGGGTGILGFHLLRERNGYLGISPSTTP